MNTVNPVDGSMYVLCLSRMACRCISSMSGMEVADVSWLGKVVPMTFVERDGLYFLFV